MRSHFKSERSRVCLLLFSLRDVLFLCSFLTLPLKGALYKLSKNILFVTDADVVSMKNLSAELKCHRNRQQKLFSNRHKVSNKYYPWLAFILSCHIIMVFRVFLLIMTALCISYKTIFKMQTTHVTPYTDKHHLRIQRKMTKKLF